MHFLALETSCDETAAAVFTDELQVLSNVVASQHSLHAAFGGVVPEIASRAHLRNLLPVVDEALRQANIELKDIGAVAAAGTASYDSGTFTLKASGADVWGTADEFRFAYRAMAGNGTITARVSTVQNVSVWTKAGVMMRESLAPGSKQAAMFVSAGKGLAFVTNDGRHGEEDFVRKLWRLGFQAAREEVVTVGGAVQFVCAGAGWRSAIVIGAAPIHRHVADAGLTILNGSDLAAAEKAWETWRDKTPKDRMELLLKLADVVDEIAAVRAAARERKGWVMDTYLLRRS